MRIVKRVVETVCTLCPHFSSSRFPFHSNLPSPPCTSLSFLFTLLFTLRHLALFPSVPTLPLPSPAPCPRQSDHQICWKPPALCPLFKLVSAVLSPSPSSNSLSQPPPPDPTPQACVQAPPIPLLHPPIPLLHPASYISCSFVRPRPRPLA
jgi:hypothetical protein